jgi:glycosyltransferase involved in cell wall biosynthesis
MCRNLLPLDLDELDRYKYKWHWFRLKLLRYLHLRAFQKADGVIFLNEYCYSNANKLTEGIGNYEIIPHGLNNEFRFYRENYAFEVNFNLLYVSTLDLYKHQWIIAEAVLELREQGYPISLTLIGEAYGMSDKKLRKTINKFEKGSQYVNWLGKISYDKLNKYYRESDAFIYGSTCETFGMTLLEAMAASLPIACSNKSSMRNMLKDAGIYFDPEDIQSIKKAILQLFNDQKLRSEIGRKSHDLASNYCWEKTAAKTFQYLSEITFT